MAELLEPAVVRKAARPATRRRRLRSVVIGVGIVALALSYAQWMVMPGVTPLMGPGLAMAGVALVTWLFIDTLVTTFRRYRAGRRLPLLSLALSAAVFVVVVALPLSRLPAAFSTPEPGAPRILSGFRDWLGAEGYPRIDGLHRGVDVAGPVGAAVLASADGRVILASDSGGSCGLMVVIVHDADGHRTIYCHLSQTSVRVGDDVRRGEIIGAVGTSGMRPWPGYEHVHWMLQMERNGPWLDPIARTVGCFDPGRTYPTDRLVLTYPVGCR